MIVVDTSAIIEIALNETQAAACAEILTAEDDLLLSAGTLAETLIVAARRGIAHEVQAVIDRLAFEVAPVTEADSRSSADAYRRWGKGFHAARLNFGDCFAYALAKDRDCGLLYVGDDFAKTDIESAL